MTIEDYVQNGLSLLHEVLLRFIAAMSAPQKKPISG